MSDRISLEPDDHPLRECFLAHLDLDERAALIPAALLLQRALYEYQRGPGAEPLHLRAVEGAAADVAHAAQEIEALLDAWGDAEKTGTRELRSAATAAADHLQTAHDLLTGALPRTGGEDDAR